MSEVISNVTETNKSKTISVPFLPGHAEEVQKQTEECMNRFCQLVAHEFSLDLEDVRKCIPTNISYTARTPMKRGKNLSTIDWEKANSKEELSLMTSVSLKDVLSSRGMRTFGPKAALVNRVWGILRPDEAPTETPPKKRGRKPGSKNKKSTIVDDSDNDNGVNLSISDTGDEDIMTMLENGEQLTLSDGSGYIFIKSKAWLFLKDEDGDLEWAGILKDGACVSTDPPQVLIDLYNQ
jgi:hypothetical protein